MFSQYLSAMNDPEHRGFAKNACVEPVPHTPPRMPHQSAWHVLHRAFLQDTGSDPKFEQEASEIEGKTSIKPILSGCQPKNRGKTPKMDGL